GSQRRLRRCRRRGRDSNPREASTAPTRLAGGRTRPLCDPPKPGNTSTEYSNRRPPKLCPARMTLLVPHRALTATRHARAALPLDLRFLGRIPVAPPRSAAAKQGTAWCPVGVAAVGDSRLLPGVPAGKDAR